MNEEQNGAGGAATLGFLDGGGALGALMRTTDWSNSPLGPPSGWSPTLTATVSMMLPTATQIVLFWGSEFTALYNDTYAPTIGDKHPRALGRPARENWAELWDDLEPLLRRARDEGETVSADDRPFYIERFGHPETVYFDISYSPVRNAQGEVEGVICLVKETTQKVLSQQRLRDSEQRFHAMADSIDQMIWSTLPNGFHDYYNQRWYDYTGVPEGSTDGEGWANMFHPDDQERAWAIWSRCLQTGEPYHIEYRLKHRSGQYRWVIGRAQPVRDESGAITRWYGTCTDIHDLKQVQDALSESETRFRQVFENAGVGMIEIDADWNILSANKAYCRITGRGPADLGGASCLSFTHQEDVEIGAAALKALAAGETDQVSFEKRYFRPDGSTTWVRSNLSRVSGADGANRFLKIVEDITDIRQAREALRESEEFNRRILASSNDCIKVLGLDGGLEMMSPGGQVVMEVDDFEAIRGADWAGMWPENERPHAIAAVEAARRGEIGRFQGFSPTAKGNMKYWDVIVSPIEGVDGRPEKLLSISRDITAYREVQQSLVESEELYRTLFSTIDEGFCVIQFLDGAEGALSDYIHIDANPAYLANAGIPDIIGKRLREIVSPSEADAWAEIYRQVLITGEPIRFERELVETGRNLDLAAFRVGPADRRQVAVLFQDITHRKRAENALREAEERYRLAARATNDAIWDWDLVSNQVLWNEALYDAHGYTLETVEPTGDWWISHIHPDDRQRVSDSIHHVIDGDGFTWTDQYRFLRADGSYASILDRGTVVRGEDGAAIRMIGAMQDVTKAREAQEAIRASEDRLRLAADATQIGIWDYDLGSDRLQWDEKVRATFGVSADAPVDYDLFLRGIHHDDRDRTDSAVKAALDPTGTGLYDIEYRTIGIDDGKERWIAARGRSQFADGKAVRFIGTTLDITARKQSEFALARSEADLRQLNETLEQRVAEEIEQRAQAEEALRQAQKMETLGQLTGGVAHDFNNLLQIVSGNVGLIQRGLPEDAGKLRRAADNAARGAERAAVLTQRLLAFSRRQPLAPKPIDPNKLISGMSDLLYRTLGEMIEVESVLAARLWAVEADPNQLENAILNLAINARDAMPDGGKLTIESCNTHLDRNYVAQNAEVVPGQYVCLCVSDTGAGMDADTVARAFEPFFTTKEVGKGTGLGLSMVYGFVKQSGGHLKIYSEPGEGTTVKIYLPRLLGERPDAEPVGEAIVPEGAQSETILVCEDDDDVRAYTVEVLRELGYRVLEAHDGPTALSLIERPGEIDLLFTDVVLPGGMTGAVLAREARVARPELRVLFTTGYARNAIVHHGRLDPGVELITKPFSYADLAARVRDMLDGQP